MGQRGNAAACCLAVLGSVRSLIGEALASGPDQRGVGALGIVHSAAVAAKIELGGVTSNVLRISKLAMRSNDEHASGIPYLIR